MSILGQGLIEILPETSRFAGRLHADVKAAVEKVEATSSGAFDKVADFGKKAFLGLGAAAGVFGVAAVKAAVEGQEATAQLRQVVENTGTSFERFEPKVESLSAKFAKFGFQNDVVEQALTRLIGITQNTATATTLLGTAADLAAARHLDLTAASQLVGRAAEGNVTALKRMGIQVEVTGDKARDGAAAIAQLNERFGGAAQAQADTYAGKLKAFRAETENLIEKVGNALLPVLANLAGKLGDAVGFFEHNRTAAEALAIIVGGPLAIAMAAFLIQEAKLAVSKIASILEGAGAAARAAAAGFAEAGIASSILLGGVGLIAAGLAAMVIHANNAQKAIDDLQRDFASKYVQSIGDGADKTQILTGHVKDLAVQAYAGAASTKEGAAAAKVYTDELKKTAVGAEAATQAQKDLGAASDDLNGKTQELADSLNLSSGEVTILAKKLGLDLAKDTGDAAGKIADLHAKLIESSPATLELRDAITNLADRTRDARDRVKDFKTALDLLIGGNLDAEKAVINLYDRIDTLGEKLKANGVNFDLHTKASRENAGAIEDTVEAIRTHIETMKNSGLAADDMRAALANDTKSLDDQLKQAGYTTAQIEALNRQYGLVPDSLNTILQADPSDAIRGIQQALDAYNHYADNVRPITIPAGSGGGVVRVFDQGGWVNAPNGAAVPALVHGGEFVLSRDMLAGRVPAPIAAGGATHNYYQLTAVGAVLPELSPEEMQRVFYRMEILAGSNA